MPYPIRKIVAGIASPTGSDPVLAPAIELAERLGAELFLIHTYDLPLPVAESYAPLGVLTPEMAQRYGESLREALVAQLREVTASERVHTRVVLSEGGHTLSKVAEEVGADLLIVGATRHGTLARNLLGTTAERVIRAARVPVLVLREPFHAPPARVLLTTDLSPFSAAIHEMGVEVVESLFPDAAPTLRSLLVVWYDVRLPPPLDRHALEASALAELDRFLAARRVPEQPVEGVVRVGEPAKEIVAEAMGWGAELLVLGTHGRRGVSRFVLGSVAGASVRSALCNVLVIPAAQLPAEAIAADVDDAVAQRT
jgi:nucleotide-binding universal stress UspA family protein